MLHVPAPIQALEFEAIEKLSGMHYHPLLSGAPPHRRLWGLVGIPIGIPAKSTAVVINHDHVRVTKCGYR
jgi:hypothetical protein